MKQQLEMNGDNIGSRLDGMMLAMLKDQMDVAEAYSPPRVAEMARKMGLKGGWSLDLTTCDSDGRMWDFNQKDMRNGAIPKLLRDQPTLLIGSPMCTAYSTMNNSNHPRMSRDEVEARMRYARQHLEFCVKLCRIQFGEGRYFPHEHPQSASSWQEKEITQLLQE